MEAIKTDVSSAMGWEPPMLTTANNAHNSKKTEMGARRSSTWDRSKSISFIREKSMASAKK